MIGKTIEINEGQKEWIERILSYAPALDKMFKKLMDESRCYYIKESNMWQELGQIAKAQFPEYDSEIHIVTWNWRTRRLTIETKERQERGMLD